MSRVIVVGGGAAGCMAAIAAAQNGHQVVLYEKNEKIGRKLFITGKGRCNVTNDCDMEALFQSIVSNEKFLYSAFHGYDNTCVQNFFNRAGCPLKTERGGRVFPVSDHSSDILKALSAQLKKAGVTVCLNTQVSRLLTETAQDGEQQGEIRRKNGVGNAPHNIVTGVILAKGEKVFADAVIVATGGCSYPSTGSTGDGFSFAKQLGLKVTQPRPGLVPLMLREDYGSRLQGLALKNVSVSLEYEGRAVYEGFGELLFTHFGVSGPLILSAGSYFSKRVPQEEGAKLFVDLKPALTLEQLDKRLLREFEENRKKQLKNAAAGLFPARLLPVMLEVSGLDGERRVGDITRAQRMEFAALIKRWGMTVTKTRGFEEAIITQGGVAVREVNPSTMESRKIKGLYFAGEVLDVDALTGGFNLQIAWSTGHLAGESIA